MALLFPNKTETQNVSEFKKADAFVNMYLPRSNGTRMKVETLKLYSDKEDHQILMKMFADNPNEAIELIKEHLIIDYNVTGAPSAGFDFVK